MATITEDYCSFEIAKLLKEKGFDEDCWCWYEEDGYLRESNDDFGVQSNSDHVVDDDEFNCSAPTLQMAMKWLREEKNIIIVIQPEYFNAESICSAFGCDIWCNDNYEKLQGDFPSHEEAVEAACLYALKNLI